MHRNCGLFSPHPTLCSLVKELHIPRGILTGGRKEPTKNPLRGIQKGEPLGLEIAETRIGGQLQALANCPAGFRGRSFKNTERIRRAAGALKNGLHHGEQQQSGQRCASSQEMKDYGSGK